jgi:NDP-sugar pyrophosphorylase family protein
MSQKLPNENLHLIIPMSGIGRRFINAGYKEPKPLIEVDGKPIIEHVVNLFVGIQKVTFICNESHLKNTNMEKTLKKIFPNCSILELSDNVKGGPVLAVSKIFNFIDDEEEIIISYCDYGTVWDFKRFLKCKNNYDGLITCYTGFHPHMLGSDNYAFCKLEDDKVTQVKEKEPFTNNKMNEFASNGTYYFKSGKIVKKYFQELIDKDINVSGEYYVSLVYNLLIEDGFNIGIYEIDKMLQWGTPYDLEIYKGWSSYFNKVKEYKFDIYCPEDTTLILPMAGRGSRFSEVGYNKPKPLIDLDGSPMVISAVKCLPKTKKQIFICQEEHIENFEIDKIIKEYYKNSQVIGINKVTEGQAITCEIAIKESNIDLEKPILISACDNGIFYYEEKIKCLLDDDTIDVIVFSFRNNQTSVINPNMYAWLDIDKQDNIKHVSCKKFIYYNPLTTHAIVGTMIFIKAKYFLDGLEKNKEENIRTNNEFYVDDVLNQNIKSGLKIKVFEVENYICWGTPDDLKTYNYWKEHFDKL